MAKATLPQRLIRDIERTLQGRINEVKNKIAEHYEQCLAELREVAETFGVSEPPLNVGFCSITARTPLQLHSSLIDSAIRDIRLGPLLRP